MVRNGEMRGAAAQILGMGGVVVPNKMAGATALTVGIGDLERLNVEIGVVNRTEGSGAEVIQAGGSSGEVVQTAESGDARTQIVQNDWGAVQLEGIGGVQTQIGGTDVVVQTECHPVSVFQTEQYAEADAQTYPHSVWDQTRSADTADQ